MKYCFLKMLESCFLMPCFCTEILPSPRHSNGNLIGLIVGINIGIASFLLFGFIVFYFIRRRKLVLTIDDEGKPEIMWHFYGSCWTSFNLVYVLKLLNFFSYFTNFFSELASVCFTLCLVHNTAHSTSIQFHVHIETAAS